MAVMFDRKFYGQGIARLLAIAPFFVMPTVSALIWKNMILHPVYGLVAAAMHAVGLQPIDWFANYSLTTIIMIVAWQWLPFAFLILFTAIQSLDQEQKEAGRIDGAGPFAMFFFITLPYLKRAIAVVVMMETIRAVHRLVVAKLTAKAVTRAGRFKGRAYRGSLDGARSSPPDCCRGGDTLLSAIGCKTQ
jgi:ABC-type sugar transport system permease subunit